MVFPIQNTLGKNSDRLSAIAVDATVRALGANTPDVGAIAEGIEDLDPTLRKGRFLAQMGLGETPQQRFKERADTIREAIAAAKRACASNATAAMEVVEQLEALHQATRDDAAHFALYVDAIALARERASVEKPAVSAVETADKQVDFSRKSQDFHLTTIANNQIGQTAIQHAAGLKVLVSGNQQIATTTLPLLEQQFQGKLAVARGNALDPVPVEGKTDMGHDLRAVWRGASIEAHSVAQHYEGTFGAEGFLALSRLLEKAQHLSPKEAVFAVPDGALILAPDTIGGWESCVGHRPG